MAPASAAPLTAPGLDSPAPIVEQAQIFKRGRPPIYPYVYTPPRRPGGWSIYFGFVPYAKGDYEVQALQRLYPQTELAAEHALLDPAIGVLASWLAWFEARAPSS